MTSKPGGEYVLVEEVVRENVEAFVKVLCVVDQIGEQTSEDNMAWPLWAITHDMLMGLLEASGITKDQVHATIDYLNREGRLIDQLKGKQA